MKKVIINSCYGGFSLSKEAVKLYVKKANLKLYSDNGEDYFTIPVEEYKKKLNEENRLYKEDKPSFTGYHSNKYAWSSYKISREDPILVDIVEKLGADAFGSYSKLKIIEIPDDVEYFIEEHDGWEYIAEKHRKWS